MKINETHLHNIVNESIHKVLNEISLDTLDSATYNSGIDGDADDIENGYNGNGHDVPAALNTIQDNLEKFSGNAQARECLKYLEKIRTFMLRKANQKDNFEQEFSSRSDNAKQRLGQFSKSKFGKDVHDLDYDEYDALGDSIGSDDDLKWAHRNY